MIYKFDVKSFEEALQKYLDENKADQSIPVEVTVGPVGPVRPSTFNWSEWNALWDANPGEDLIEDLDETDEDLEMLDDGWALIDDEVYREYIFGAYDTVKINEPKFFRRDERGFDEIETFAGVYYKIPDDWIAMKKEFI